MGNIFNALIALTVSTVLGGVGLYFNAENQRMSYYQMLNAKFERAATRVDQVLDAYDPERDDPLALQLERARATQNFNALLKEVDACSHPKRFLFIALGCDITQSQANLLMLEYERIEARQTMFCTDNPVACGIAVEAVESQVATAQRTQARSVFEEEPEAAVGNIFTDAPPRDRSRAVSGPVAPAPTILLYVHFADPGSRDAVEALVARGGDLIDEADGMPVRFLGPGLLDVAPARPELRFLKPGDRAAARAVVDALNQAQRYPEETFAVTCPNVELVDLTRRYGQDPRVEARSLELWFPKGTDPRCFDLR